jgi:hypothetical protein
MEEELRASTQRLYPKTGENNSSTEEDESDDWIFDAAMALEDLRENETNDAMALEELEEMEMDAQSLSDTDKLQGRPLEMHSAQRGESSNEGSTRHSIFEASQRTQGVDMTTPPLETSEANLRRRSACDGTLRGMVTKKRKHWHLEKDDDLRSLNPEDGKESENYGYRDEAEERGAKCYKPSHDVYSGGGTALNKE